MERWMDCKIDETPVITGWTRVIYFLVFTTIISRTFFSSPLAVPVYLQFLGTKHKLLVLVLGRHIFLAGCQKFLTNVNERQIVRAYRTNFARNKLSYVLTYRRKNGDYLNTKFLQSRITNIDKLPWKRGRFQRRWIAPNDVDARIGNAIAERAVESIALTFVVGWYPHERVNRCLSTPQT